MSEDLSIKVRNELYRKKMTQATLASMLGISQPYLSDVLLGKRTGPKAQEHIKHIRKILSI